MDAKPGNAAASVAWCLCLAIGVMMLSGFASVEGASASAAGSGQARFQSADSILRQVGAGSYRIVSPAEARRPPAEIFRTENVTGPMPTNRWWSSAAWLPLSEAMYGHPLAFRAFERGLGVSYPRIQVQGGSNPSYHGLYQHDLTLEVEGLHTREARVDGYSDWTVDLRFAGEGVGLTTRIGHGFPYVYARFWGGNPVVTFLGFPNVWAHDPVSPTVGITINENHYALFCPDGGTWSGVGTRRFTCHPPDGADFFALAVLPDTHPETLQLFKKHAFAFPTDTRVTWAYDDQTGSVETVYTVDTEMMAGTEASPLIALYPHQWHFAGVPETAFTYRSPRGTMKLIPAKTFTTTHTFPGMLPFLPPLPKEQAGYLASLLKSELQMATPWLSSPGGGELDTYWMGKSLNRLAQLVPIADQLGDTATRDELLTHLKHGLEDWFSASESKRSRLFDYDDHWGTLIGYPASHGTDTDLNDHHFHYGYFIHAAALVALWDPDWAADQRWGGMVRLLARDWASADRADPMFPFLRTFDVYAGHSWASGTGKMREGNNQESSSEAIHAWSALILFGEATGDRQMRDLGIWGYTLETEAAHRYWFDVEGNIFPEGYEPPTIGRLFSSGGDYNTWWTHNAVEVHGINLLPITGASVHLGRSPEYVRANVAYLKARTGGNLHPWPDIILSYLALADPDRALALWREDLRPEAGGTRAHTFHWLNNLQHLGRVSTAITGDTPLSSVFENHGKLTYAAFNASATTRRVTFSDGTAFDVAPRSLGTLTRSGA